MNITFEAPVTERRVQIVILNDNVLESVEQFSVTIVAVEGVFPVEVIDAVAVVEITDNDRKSWELPTRIRLPLYVYTYQAVFLLSIFIPICFSPHTCEITFCNYNYNYIIIAGVVIGFQLGTDSIDESVGGSGLLRGTLEILSGVLSRDAVIQFQSLAEDNQDSQATEGVYPFS